MKKIEPQVVLKTFKGAGSMVKPEILRQMTATDQERAVPIAAISPTPKLNIFPLKGVAA
jgi:hypothetical protein